MKVLCIGNSFSSDSTRYIEDIARADNYELKVRNLYIGGCSLERHVKEFKENNRSYEYQKDSAPFDYISLRDGLMLDNWDIITIQQASHYSGKLETYEPYLGELITIIKKSNPQAKIMFIKTWAYEIDSDHPNFPDYDKSQIKMYEEITSVVSTISNMHNIEIIPVGDVIQRLRHTKEFDYINGGLSLCRDGFHLSFIYGRLAAALTLYKSFTKRDVSRINYYPELSDKKLVDVVRKTV